MGFGRHWEWRGFGAPDPAVAARIRRLTPLFATPQELTDRYLWSPSSCLNLKLRGREFKIKRAIRKGPGGLEEWLEDPAESFRFPLEWPVFEEVVRDLGGGGPERPSTGSTVESEERFLRELAARVPALRLVPVAKRRWQYAAPSGEGVVVEYAEIFAPVRTVSVGIEHEEEERVREVLALLGLPGGLETSSYLDALGAWATGAA